MEFTEKAVFITGAAGGLGRSAALGFARGGARLVLLDVDGAGLEQVAQEVAGLGGDVHSVVADVTDRDACVQAIEAAVARFGRLDVLCNIAGILRLHKLEEVSEADWRKLLDVNVTGPFFLSQAAIPHLVQAHGTIINVASPAAAFGHAYMVPYSVSKAALVQLTRSMAMEFINEPVRINAVLPASMKTGLARGQSFSEGVDFDLVRRYTNIRPLREPEDVADVLLFLASDKARTIHGACIAADDGITAG